MNIAKVISIIGVLAMMVALANGFINGNISSNGDWTKFWMGARA